MKKIIKLIVFLILSLAILTNCAENIPEHQDCDYSDYASCPQNYACFRFYEGKNIHDRCLRECCSNGTIQCPEGYFCTFPMNESGIMYCLEDYYKPIMETFKSQEAEVICKCNILVHKGVHTGK